MGRGWKRVVKRAAFEGGLILRMGYRAGNDLLGPCFGYCLACAMLPFGICAAFMFGTLEGIRQVITPEEDPLPNDTSPEDFFAPIPQSERPAIPTQPLTFSRGLRRSPGLQQLNRLDDDREETEETVRGPSPPPQRPQTLNTSLLGPHRLSGQGHK